MGTPFGVESKIKGQVKRDNDSAKGKSAKVWGSLYGGEGTKSVKEPATRIGKGGNSRVTFSFGPTARYGLSLVFCASD